MRRCTACSSTFDGDGWTCPSCGHAPDVAADGRLLFAPDLVGSGDGWNPDSFEMLAQHEDRHFWFRGRNRIITAAIAEHFPRATSLFELGCGTGYVLSGISARFPRVELWAGDLHPEGLGHADERVPDATVVQVDGRDLPFDRHFDVTCAFDVLEHIDDHEGAARSMFAATRPGGGIVVTVPQHRWLWSAADDYARHCRRYRRRELVDLLEGAGFAVEQVTSFATSVLPLMALSRVTSRGRSADDFDPEAEFRIGTRTNAVLERMMGADARLIRAGASLPAGGSLLAVGRRPAEPDAGSGAA